MEAKEKAQELVGAMNIAPGSFKSLVVAKEHAIILVNEILELYPKSSDFDFWIQVKEEIKTL